MSDNFEITFKKFEESLAEYDEKIKIKGILQENDAIRKLQECIDYVKNDDCYTILTRA